jgi:hypothetical protein
VPVFTDLAGILRVEGHCMSGRAGYAFGCRGRGMTPVGHADPFKVGPDDAGDLASRKS